jgi:hypothetical protein
MADPDGELTVAERLGRALDRGLLPAGGPAEAAERLIERLERPARVALLGLPGSGKSSILNLLVGTVVVSETLRLPTMIVQYGDVPRMICTLTDGTTKILPGSNLAEVLPFAPALVTLEMDLPALKVISLLEVSAGPMEAEQKRAATWASKRADIVIWCTTSYLPKEQAVWESLPDAVKDNSFMFLTKVDLLGSRESASAMHQRVEFRAGEEFRQILSISAKQARSAMPPGGPVNRDLFRESGASAVIGAIKTRVQSGRRADMDTAELLLARHVEASEFVARRFAEPGEEAGAAKPWTPPPEAEEAPKPALVAEPDVVRPDVVEEAAEEADTALEAKAEVADDTTAEAAEEDVTTADEVGPVTDDALSTGPGSDPDEETVAVKPETVGPLAQREDLPDTAPEPEPEPDLLLTTRKRFADRIKRVAADGKGGSAPLVPLRSTWKSKSEAEVTPAPEPEPVVRPPEPVRRPRPAPRPMQEEEAGAEARAEPAAEPEETAEHEPPPRERAPRAVTPRPGPAPESPRTARPQLFGNRRGAGAADAPLPDLSALRATPEEIAASAEANSQQPDDQTEGIEPVGGLPDDDWETDAAPTPEPEPLASEARPAESLDRAGRFDRTPREPRAEPAVPVSAEPMPRTSPILRSPAPPRMGPPAVAERAAPSRPAADDSLFTPRAIMMRERRAEPDAPAPRRERPRIAARAVPAAAAPVASPAVTATDHGLLDEAISLIVARSMALEQDIDPEAKVPVDMILDHARETGEQVMALVSRGQSEALRQINNDLGGVMDTITLMQLEKGHAPADDALTLLLQLKRELETLRAV